MEKTFEELAIGFVVEKGFDQHELINADIVASLLEDFGQQVREATIAECHIIADKYYFQNSENIIKEIHELPTDRIVTEKN